LSLKVPEVGFRTLFGKTSAHSFGVQSGSQGDIDSDFIDAYNELMRVHFKPTTSLGKRSAWLIFTFAVSMTSFGILVASGQRGGDTFFSNPILTVPGFVAATSGIAAFITGLISIVRRKERSISVYLAVVFGLITLVFVLGEIIFPH